jgi:3',5'-cyclic AMP phosphodiesterase CpdA
VAVPAEQIYPQAFAEVMGPYGYEDALYRDEASLSYVACLADDLWLLTLDANVPEQRGYITADTLEWAEPLLAQAQKEGIRVVVMSHQNVLIQNSMMYNGYVIHNHEAVEHMLKKYGVSMVMSGHSHLEHTAVSEGLTDICSESLAVYPLQYGMITLAASDHGFLYEKKKLGILEQESFERFAETVERMVSDIVNDAAHDEA